MATTGEAAHVVSESKDSLADRGMELWRPVPNCQPTSPQESSRLRLPPLGFALLVALAAFFVYLSHRPLWHTDLWGHLAYGRQIAAFGIPETEPLLPLCQGVTFVDFSWLSELLAYHAYAWRGAAALQFAYAGSVTFCVAVLALCSLRKTGSVVAAALAAAIYVWVDWQQLAIVRPQLAGCACFLLVFAFGRARLLPSRIAGENRLSRSFALPRTHGLLIAVLFAVWANLHGSFLVGLALLAAFGCGRVGDLVRRTGSLRAVLGDSRVRRGAVLMFVATAAVMLNPYGWRIYPEAWHLSSNPNLADLVEWKPPGLWMSQGRAAVAVTIGLVALYLLTPRRISTTELLLLVGFGAATLATSRMIVWWGPIAAYYASAHAAAIWKRRRGGLGLSTGSTRRVPARFATLVVCAALVCTPLTTVLSQRPVHDPRESLSPQTPVEAVDFLCEDLSFHGQIFNTLEWGDYLLWAGPPGLEVFVASHVHLVPRPVWEDYMRVITLDDGWRTVLERYRINTAIVDDDQHAALADALREDPAWSIAYEDAQGLVLVRRRPL
jgi:hypothetical protein